jgi:hypothetical protein
VTFPWRKRGQLTLGTYDLFPSSGLPFRLPYQLPPDLITSHGYCIGTSGSGKSYFLLSLMLQLFSLEYPFTLIDPHGDLANMLLDCLIAQGVYRDPAAYERILFVDIPSAEQQNLYLPFNVLDQPLPDDARAANIKDVFHRAWQELDSASATFDRLLVDCILLLLHNDLPLIYLDTLLIDSDFRTTLLANEHDQFLVNSLQKSFGELKKADQLQHANSLLNRARQLTQINVLRYGLSQHTMPLNFRRIMDNGQTVIINLATLNRDACRLLGCFLTVGAEQGAKSRANIPEALRTSHHLFIDEFQLFTPKNAAAFDAIFSEARKYRLSLWCAHQTIGQTTERTQSAIQNTRVKAFMNTGERDAKILASLFSRFDPMKIKHEVTDEHAVERTHPLFDPPTEQQKLFEQTLTDLPDRHFLLKLNRQEAVELRTLTVPKPNLDPKEVAEVKQEYLNRLFTPVQTPAQQAQEDTIIQLPKTVDGVVHQPYRWRERWKPID